MKCPSCSAENAADHSFCSHCGTRLVLACARCSFENLPGARFCGGCGQPVGVAAEAPAAMDTPIATAERRQLTILFCDLVDSTELAGQVDPEELSDLYRAYRELAEAVVEQHGGHVAEYLGDGIVAYFGYPRALENSADRAVRSALTLIDALAQRQLAASGRHPVSARVGIATGLVVAGDLLGQSDNAQVRTVVGDTPNLAARLQSTAPNNGIVIGELTRRLLGPDFLIEAQPPRSLKGIADPVNSFRVLGMTDARQAPRTETGQRLIGRDRELATFQSLFSDVQFGRGRGLLLIGEPGIGKSRLIRGFNESLADEAHVTLELRGSSLHQNTALFPVLDLLRRSFDIDEDETAGLENLAVGLEGAGWRREEVMPLFSAQLQLPYSGEDANAELSAEARRRRMLEVLASWVFKLSEAAPVLLIAENQHWFDPTTRELLDVLLRQCPTAHLMMIITSRPESSLSDWQSQPHVHSMPLGALKPEDVAELVRELAGPTLPAAVIEQLQARSDGVPLFVEEMTRTILESQAAFGGSNSDASRAAQLDLSVPETLQDTLMSRLDRLGTAKELAQRGAVLGREFHYREILDLSDRPADQLETDLARLVQAQLLYQRGQPPRASYYFKHALIQDIAYLSLLNRNRQSLHARTARMLIESFPERAEREPEVVAEHYRQAGEAPAAISQLLKAAAIARNASAQVEAVNHLRQALELLDSVPDPDAKDGLDLAVRTAFTGPLINTTGYANPEVRDNCERARALAETAGTGPDLPLAMYGLTTFYLNSCDLVACREVSSQLLELAGGAGFEMHEPAAHLQLSFATYFTGALETSMAHLERNMAVYDLDRHRDLYERYGQDPGASALAQAAVVAWQLGQVDSAVSYGERGVALAREIGDPFTLAMTQNYYSYALVHRRDRPAALAASKAAIELCEKQNFPQWLNQARVVRGWALADASTTTAEGVEQMLTALAELAKVGAVVGGPFFLSLLTEALLNARALDQAGNTIDQALGLSTQLGNTWMDANLLRLKAVQRRMEGSSDDGEVEALLRRSCEHACSTSSRIHETRALHDLWRFGLAVDADLERLEVLSNEVEAGHGTPDRQEMLTALARA